MSPALADGFFTTEPSEKSLEHLHHSQSFLRFASIFKKLYNATMDKFIHIDFPIVKIILLE